MLFRSLLRPGQVEHDVSESFRPLATAILEERGKLNLTPAFGDGWWVDMRAYEDNYSKKIYVLAQPIATRLFGEDIVTRNRALSRFANEVVWSRRGAVALWALEYWPRAILKVLYRSWILWLALPLWVGAVLRRRWVADRKSTRLNSSHT